MKRKRTFFDDDFGTQFVVDVFDNGVADITMLDEVGIGLTSPQREALIRTLEAVPSE